VPHAELAKLSEDAAQLAPTLAALNRAESDLARVGAELARARQADLDGQIAKLSRALETAIAELDLSKKSLEEIGRYSAPAALASAKGITAEALGALVNQMEPEDPSEIDFVSKDIATGREIRRNYPDVSMGDIKSRLDFATKFGDLAGREIPDDLSAWLSLPPEKRSLAVDIAKDADDGSIERVRKALRSEIDLVDDVTSAVQLSLGSLVDGVGGVIDPDSGSISLPDEVLFDVQSARLTPSTQAFLKKFCGPWIETVHAFGDRIKQMQIEGHSSSEWGALQGQAAYLQNLNLSQQRSAAVVQFCLAQDLQPDVAAWARSVLVAVGLSSSRPVLLNGTEDSVRSRRVIFGFDIDKGKIIDDIKRSLDAERAEVLPPDGKPELPIGSDFGQ